MLEVCIFSGFFAQNFHFLAVRWCFSTHINPWTFGHVPCIEDRKDVVDIRPANTKESTHLGYSANKQFEEEKSLNYIQSYGDGARIKDRNFYNYRLIAFNHIISSKNVHVWMHNTYRIIHWTSSHILHLFFKICFTDGLTGSKAKGPKQPKHGRQRTPLGHAESWADDIAGLPQVFLLF